MGVHISIRRFQGFDEDYDEIISENVNEEIGWDYLRQSGDTDFCYNYPYEKTRLEDKYTRLFKPKSFDDARQWVQENVEGNKKRYLDAFEKMEKDESLWFSFSS